MELSEILLEKAVAPASKLKVLQKELKNEIFKESFLQDMDKYLRDRKSTPNSILLGNIIAIMGVVNLQARSTFSEHMLNNTDSVNFLKIKNNRVKEILREKKRNNNEDINESEEETDDCQDDNDSGYELELPSKYNEKTKKHYTNIIQYLFLHNRHLSPSQKSKYLMVLPKFLPYVAKPLQYTDVLYDAFDLGGRLAVSALPGVYYLITRENLDYPELYEKVYSLMDENALGANCRRIFFQTVQDMLFSPYVPDYMAAAFVKKASRMTLRAAESRLLLLTFIKNVCVKFPTIRHLIHNPNAKDLDVDPYLEAETATNCKAMESSLFELEMLMNHPLRISRAASFIKTDLTGRTTRLDTTSKSSPSEWFAEAVKVRQHVVSTNFEKPDGFSYQDNEITGWEWA